MQKTAVVFECNTIYQANYSVHFMQLDFAWIFCSTFSRNFLFLQVNAISWRKCINNIFIDYFITAFLNLKNIENWIQYSMQNFEPFFQGLILWPDLFLIYIWNIFDNWFQSVLLLFYHCTIFYSRVVLSTILNEKKYFFNFMWP